MDQIEEPTVHIQKQSVLEPQFQAFSSEIASDPLSDASDHVSEDVGVHSDQWLSQLQNLELKEKALRIESWNSASDGEDDRGEMTGKCNDESDGNDRIQSETVVDGCVNSKENYESNVRKEISFPVRPEALDCAFYMRTGNCKFGANCRFNHPIRTRGQAVKEKDNEENEQTPGQRECKYYIRTGGCKYGKGCRFIHSKAKTHNPSVSELNFVGLPIRSGEKECPFYMRNGSCKFGVNCRFNHPDPKAVREADPARAYASGVPHGSPSLSQCNVVSWSVQRSPLQETTPYVPVLSSTQGISSQSSEWNGFQTPTHSQETSLRLSSAFAANDVAIGTTIHPKNQAQPLSDDEFPERAGEPMCNYFLKPGDCKFKSTCKYHHLKNGASKLPPCALSDNGLPLRPDQRICSHYSRYGICKFGPACKFDHPIKPSSSSLFDPDKPMASTS